MLCVEVWHVTCKLVLLVELQARNHRKMTSWRRLFSSDFADGLSDRLTLHFDAAER